MAASAVVGLLRTVLTLDPKEFEAGARRSTTAADKMVGSLKGLERESLRAGDAVERMARGLGGSRLLQTANNLTAAVERIGGASKLTAAEQERLSGTIGKAIDKYAALGQQAPAAMAALHTSLQKPVASTNVLDAAVGRLGATMAATFSVGAILGFAKSIGSFASQMVDLSAETQIGVERLQAWNFVLTGAGVKVEEWAASLQQLSKRLASGDDSAVAAVQRLGLSVQDLIRMGPEEAFLAIGRAVSGIENPMERTRTVMELFGRSGSRMLRVMTEDLEGVVDAAEKSGAVIQKELIESADRFDDAWQQAILRVKASMVNFAGVVGKAMTSTGSGPGAFADAKAGAGFPQSHPLAARTVALGEFFDSATPFGITGAGVGATASGLPAKIRETTKQGEEATKKFSQFIAEVRRFGEEQFRQLMAVSSVIPQFGSLPGSLAQENRFGPLAFAGAFNPGAGLPQVVPGAIPDWMKRENMGIFDNAPSGGGFSLTGLMKDRFGPTIMSAVTGGGNVGQSLGGLLGGGLTSKLATTGAGKALSSVLGGVIGSVIPGLGTMVGAVVGPMVGKFFGKLFGGEGKKTEEARTKGMEQFGGAEAFKAMAREAGVAEAQIARVFNAKKVKDYETALKAVTTQIDAHNQLLKDQQELTDAQTKRQKMLNDAVARYGFETEELGPKLKQQRLAEQAEELLTDWQLLAEAGFDINTMAKRMSGSINEFIKIALKTGTEVPNAMRPMLEAMMQQGLLTDENGELLKDLTRINFGESLTEQFSNVLLKLDELIERLIEATKPRTVVITTRHETEGTPPDDQPQIPQNHQGGIVAHMGRLIGTGEVMVRALRGEAFLNKAATAALGGKPMIDAINNQDWASVFSGFANLSGGLPPAMPGIGADFGPMAFPGNGGIESRLDETNARLSTLSGRISSIMATIPMHIEAAVIQGRARR